jgi:hypothetical protein
VSPAPRAQPAQRIQTCALGDEGLRRDRRVEVLISTGN